MKPVEQTYQVSTMPKPHNAWSTLCVESISVQLQKTKTNDSEHNSVGWSNAQRVQFPAISTSDGLEHEK